MGVFDARAATLARSGGRQIDSADVIALLREVYAEGIGTREEAEELIAFDQSLADPTPGWVEFFAETIADHVIRHQASSRVVDGEKTAWLIAVLGKGRHAVSAGGFAAVLRLIELAHDITPTLAAYAIRQVRSAVLAGRRPASTTRLFFNRTIDAETALLLRRIVLGCAGQSARPVSRAEAEALFDLHDLTASSTNDADFEDFFYKAVVHHLIAETGEAVPARKEALARGVDFPVGLPRIASLGPDQTAWLASQIMRDGRPTAAEFKLLEFFTDNGRSADPALRQFMTQAA